jgi:putative peptidoglycan lipid II flippase
MVYLLPYAVLAVPIATAAFPRLSQHAHEDVGAYTRTLASSTRAVLIVSIAGAAALVAAAWPIARFLSVLSQAPEVPVSRMAWALVGFAPGLLGYGLVAHLGRALYARRRGRAAAAAIVTGWLVAAAGAVVAANVTTAERVVAGFGLAHALGMTVAGLLLLRAIVVDAGRPALAGLVRTLAVAGCGGLVGAAGGFGFTVGLAELNTAAIVGSGALAALFAAAAVLAALWLGARDDVKAVLRR